VSVPISNGIETKSNRIAREVVDLRELLNPSEQKPGANETVLNINQLRELNPKLNLSNVQRPGGRGKPLGTQFEGWSGSTGGVREHSSLIPDGSGTLVKSVDWLFNINKPITSGKLFKTPPGSIVYSGTEPNDNRLTIENRSGSGNEPRVGRIVIETGTRRIIEDGVGKDTGEPSTKITVGNWGGPQTSVEVMGTVFFDQKNGELKVVRYGGENKYFVQDLKSAIVQEYGNSSYSLPDLVKALDEAGFRPR
jgi:hypothetical protein